MGQQKHTFLQKLNFFFSKEGEITNNNKRKMVVKTNSCHTKIETI